MARSCYRQVLNCAKEVHTETRKQREQSFSGMLRRCRYYLLAGGMMPFIRRYSTIWP
jgi:hypothetical protein